MVLPLLIGGAVALAAVATPFVVDKFRSRTADITRAEAEKVQAEASRTEAEARRAESRAKLSEESAAAESSSATDDFLIIAKKAGPWVLLGVGIVGLLFAVSQMNK